MRWSLESLHRLNNLDVPATTQARLYPKGGLYEVAGVAVTGSPALADQLYSGRSHSDAGESEVERQVAWNTRMAPVLYAKTYAMTLELATSSTKHMLADLDLRHVLLMSPATAAVLLESYLRPAEVSASWIAWGAAGERGSGSFALMLSPSQRRSLIGLVCAHDPHPTPQQHFPASWQRQGFAASDLARLRAAAQDKVLRFQHQLSSLRHTDGVHRDEVTLPVQGLGWSLFVVHRTLACLAPVASQQEEDPSPESPRDGGSDHAAVSAAAGSSHCIDGKSRETKAAPPRWR